MLRLRPFRTNDAKTIIAWTSEPKEFYMWNAGLMGDYPVCQERLLEAVSSRYDNPKYFPFVAFDEDGLVGFLTIRAPGEDDKKLSFGYVIINPLKRGLGLGKKMLEISLKFAFDIYGANEVSLHVYKENNNALNCYKSIGFKETGKQELCEIGGYTLNSIEMAIRKEETK